MTAYKRWCLDSLEWWWAIELWDWGWMLLYGQTRAAFDIGPLRFVLKRKVDKANSGPTWLD